MDVGRVAAMGCAVFLAAWGARAQSAREAAPAGYGWQTGASDLGALMILGGGAAAGSPGLAYAGLGTFVLGGPVIHLFHGHPGRAAASFGLRTLLPLAAGYLGGTIAQGAACTGEDCHVLNALGGASLGVLAGAVAASLVDGLMLTAPDPEPPPRLAFGFSGKAVAFSARF
ncbi:MAG TPA: hypothetical protein VI356_02625 [Myxococcales bacterium]